MLVAFAVLMLSFSVIGFSYAAWITTLTINGNVTFGKLSLIWSNAQFDHETSPTGQWSVGIDGTHKILTVTIGNAYPGYEVWFYVQTTNDGTLPVRYDNVKCTGTNDASLDSHFTLTFYDPSKTPNIVGTFAQWKGTAHVYRDNGIADQYVTFDPTVAHWSYVSISIDDSVDQTYSGLTYTATFELTGVLP
jgi:hypothetical protein